MRILLTDEDLVMSSRRELRQPMPKWVTGQKIELCTLRVEISAYDCYAASAMVLSSATSSIGAHHKDAWMISWEVKFGGELPFDTLVYTADKIPKLIWAFLDSEYTNNWANDMDVPPVRWFTQFLTVDPLKGAMLDLLKYDAMLNKYYRKKGWDERGIPKKSKLKKQCLSDVVNELGKYINLNE